MATSCDSTSLVAASKCFDCLTDKERSMVSVYLLAVLAGGSLDPKTLLKAASCYGCFTDKEREQVIISLLCTNANK